MMRRDVRNTTRILAALLFALVVAVAAAQDIDPRARELLEGLGQGAPTELHNMDTTAVMTTYVGEGESMIVNVRTVVDYDNERAAIVTDMQGMQTTMKLVDGVLTMNVMGMQMPAPPGAAEQFDSIFERPGGDMLAGDFTATYDGEVSYGDLLAGEGVTYQGDVSAPNAPDAAAAQYVFGADGALLGMHMSTSDGEMLMVYDEPMTGANWTAADMKVYMMENGSWRLFSEMTYEAHVINGELDESLFE